MPYAMIFYYNNFLAYCLLNLRKLKIGGHSELVSESTLWVVVVFVIFNYPSSRS